MQLTAATPRDTRVCEIDDSTQTVDWLVSLSQHSGGFSLLSVTSKGPWFISFHVKEKESATEAFGSIRVRDSMQLGC